MWLVSIVMPWSINIFITVQLIRNPNSCSARCVTVSLQLLRSTVIIIIIVTFIIFVTVLLFLFIYYYHFCFFDYCYYLSLWSFAGITFPCCFSRCWLRNKHVDIFQVILIFCIPFIVWSISGDFNQRFGLSSEVGFSFLAFILNLVGAFKLISHLFRSTFTVFPLFYHVVR